MSYSVAYISRMRTGLRIMLRKLVQAQFRLVGQVQVLQSCNTQWSRKQFKLAEQAGKVLLRNNVTFNGSDAVQVD